MSKTIEPVKVAHVIGKITRAGVESVICNLLSKIDSDCFEFIVLYDNNSPFSPRKSYLDAGIKFIPISPVSSPRKHIKDIISVCNTEKITILHSSLNTLSVFPLYAAKKAGVPIRISHSHTTAGKGELIRNTIKWFLKLFSHFNATHFIACSIAASEYQFGKRLTNSGTVLILRNAIDTDHFKYSDQNRTRIRRDLGISNDTLVLGNIGRLVSQKNQQYIIKIAKLLKQQNAGFVVLIIGSGPLLLQLQEEASKLGCADNIILISAMDDVAPYYSAMDVFLLPSLYEGLGVVAVEAQASGLPTLLSSRIPQEAKLTSECTFLNIDDCNTSIWAETIINTCVDTKARYKSSDIVKSSGYDLTSSAIEYTEFLKRIVIELEGCNEQ